jgi:hypothetical protein
MKRATFVPYLPRFVIAIAIVLSPLKGTAGVNVNIGVNVPFPALEIDAPPAVVVIPGTYARILCPGCLCGHHLLPELLVPTLWRKMVPCTEL